MGSLQPSTALHTRSAPHTNQSWHKHGDFLMQKFPFSETVLVELLCSVDKVPSPKRDSTAP